MKPSSNTDDDGDVPPKKIADNNDQEIIESSDSEEGNNKNSVTNTTAARLPDFSNSTSSFACLPPGSSLDDDEEPNGTSTSQHHQPRNKRYPSSTDGAFLKERNRQVVDDDDVKPGAYAIAGRAAGQLPSFARSQMVNPNVSSNSMWDSSSQFNRDDIQGGIQNGITQVLNNSTETSAAACDSSSAFDIEGQRTTHSRHALTQESTADCVATVVDDDELQKDMRNSVLSETTPATDVKIDNSSEKHKRKIIVWACTLLTALGLVIGLSVALTRDKSSREDIASGSPTIAPTHNPLPTLEIIENNDYVRCGVQWIPALETDLCRALAAAILGDPDKIQTTSISWEERWEALEKDRKVDVLTIGNTITMNRNVHQKDTKTGFTFSDPFVYDGLLFEGIPEYVDCMDRLDTYFGNCGGVRICIREGSTGDDILTDYVYDFKIRQATDNDEMHQMFVDGKCNVIAVYAFDNSEFFIRQKKYHGNYTTGSYRLTYEPMAMATRKDDPEFSDFVNWVLRALMAAEEQNITKDTASKFMTTTVFGEEYQNMFVNAIEAVGNYGDLYKKHFEPISPRASAIVNSLNNGSTGLHYPYPLGQESFDAPNPNVGSTIFEITNRRGNLRCGIMERDGFGEVVIDNSTNLTRWQGMDADYCYALSASLFQGDSSKVVFVKLTSGKSGYQALNDGKVDVFAGGRITLESDVKEASTGKGFSFSMPYFYGNDEDDVGGGDGTMHQHPMGGIAMVTREDDAQFSDFVFWTVAATIIAEDQLITQTISGDMIEVSGFGPRYKAMHRHAITAVGNYAEIYNRSVEKIIQRQGRNLLNTNPFGPQIVSWF